MVVLNPSLMLHAAPASNSDNYGKEKQQSKIYR